MKAKHPGPCAACGGRIHPGDEIEPSRDTETVTDGSRRTIRTVPAGWQHATCGSIDRGQTDLLDPTEAGDLCPECFTYHRGECA